MPRFSLSNGLWLASYLACMAGLVYWLAAARGWALTELTTPQAQSEWQRWKRDATEHTVVGDGPIERRAPKSDEPPALVILRDSFPGVILTCLALGSFVFCFLMVVIRGAFRSATRHYLGARGNEWGEPDSLPRGDSAGGLRENRGPVSAR